MRMRKKKNLIPRLNRCTDVQIKTPERLRGNWMDIQPNCQSLHVELGCGKGSFTAETAAAAPETLLVAIERVPDALVVAMERAVAAQLNNALFIDMDVSRLSEIFAPGEVERIYINFCDPWPSKKHAKRRLTSPGFLTLYSQVLKPGGEIYFKTDNQDLFDYSLEQFVQSGYALFEVTNNLHGERINGVMTDYEKNFYKSGIQINRCVARLVGEI